MYSMKLSRQKTSNIFQPCASQLKPHSIVHGDIGLDTVGLAAVSDAAHSPHVACLCTVGFQLPALVPLCPMLPLRGCRDAEVVISDLGIAGTIPSPTPASEDSRKLSLTSRRSEFGEESCSPKHRSSWQIAGLLQPWHTMAQVSMGSAKYRYCRWDLKCKGSTTSGAAAAFYTCCLRGMFPGMHSSGMPSGGRQAQIGLSSAMPPRKQKRSAHGCWREAWLSAMTPQRKKFIVSVHIRSPNPGCGVVRCQVLSSQPISSVNGAWRADPLGVSTPRQSRHSGVPTGEACKEFCSIPGVPTPKEARPRWQRVPPLVHGVPNLEKLAESCAASEKPAKSPAESSWSASPAEKLTEKSAQCLRVSLECRQTILKVRFKNAFSRIHHTKYRILSPNDTNLNVKRRSLHQKLAIRRKILFIPCIWIIWSNIHSTNRSTCVVVPSINLSFEQSEGMNRLLRFC